MNEVWGQRSQAMNEQLTSLAFHTRASCIVGQRGIWGRAGPWIWLILITAQKNVVPAPPTSLCQSTTPRSWIISNANILKKKKKRRWSEGLEGRGIFEVCTKSTDPRAVGQWNFTARLWSGFQKNEAHKCRVFYEPPNKKLFVFYLKCPLRKIRGLSKCWARYILFVAG